ncbi:hypothetical protein EV368DRAFT_70035 [Lentinula lateritia]|nr:hypothetical protein EV368DRAFT_70035 [Lentinula lateritia]
MHGENLDPFEQFEVFKVDKSAEGLNEQYYYFIDQENMLSSENTKFNLVGWWRKWLDRWLPRQRELVSQIRMRVNRPRGNRKKDMDYPRMGRILAIEARKTLARYVPLTDDPEDTSIDFYSVLEDLNNPGQYTVEDEGRNFKTKISSTLLMNPAFNLPDWYKKHLKMAEKELQRRISGPVEYEFLPRLYGKPTSPFEHETFKLSAWVWPEKNYAGMQNHCVKQRQRHRSHPCVRSTIPSH